MHGLKSGDSIFIRGPYGKGFPLEKFAGSHLVIAAGGSGLAPVKPLISRYFKNPSELKGLDILLGFKNSASVIFPEEIKKWESKFNVIITVDRGDEGWTGRTGLITERVKEMSLPQNENINVVVVGPPAMMKFTAAEFALRKIPNDRIWVSFERLMSCGIGKCGHCKIDYHYVCIDGPVMNYSMAARLID
jgi:anaerobic sulfite reductase subunit B